MKKWLRLTVCGWPGLGLCLALRPGPAAWPCWPSRLALALRSG